MRGKFIVETTLVSTMLTQNEGLSSLLKWRNEPIALQRNLREFDLKINSDELVKFIRDVLDALFSIMMETEGTYRFNNLENQVFKNLIKCISLITEEGDYKSKAPAKNPKHHFIPILELYINENFYHMLAYDKLLDVLAELLENAVRTPAEVAKVLECLKYVFKFIVKSRLLYSEFHKEHKEEANQGYFEEKLKEVLDSLTRLMSYQSKELHNAQSACLRNMIQSMPDLAKVYSQKKLAEVLKGMIKALPEEQLEDVKLDVIKELIRSDIFKDRDCRLILLPQITHELRQILERCQNTTLRRNIAVAGKKDTERVEQCTSTLGEVLDVLYAISREKGAEKIHEGKYES